MGKKKMYLIGTEDIGVVGYTFDKKIAQEFVKQRTRKKFKYDIITVKNDERVYNIINKDTVLSELLMYSIFETDYILTESDEQYLIQSFDQYITDAINIIDNFISGPINYIRFSEEEKEQLLVLLTFVTKVKKRFKKIYNTKEDWYPYEGNEYESIFDINEIVKFFIKYIV